MILMSDDDTKTMSFIILSFLEKNIYFRLNELPQSRLGMMKKMMMLMIIVMMLVLMV